MIDIKKTVEMLQMGIDGLKQYAEIKNMYDQQKAARDAQAAPAIPEYEILEFRGDAWPYPYVKDSVSGKYKYKHEPHGTYFTHDECVNMGLKIHSVRRNSDNTTWAVGEEANGYTIESFGLKKDGLWAKGRALDFSSFIHISALIKPDKPVERKPLFVTEDGKNIFDGDIYFIVTPDFRVTDEFKANQASSFPGSFPNIRSKCFSTKANAEAHIRMNKPCLSYGEVRHELMATKENGGDLSAAINRVFQAAIKKLK